MVWRWESSIKKFLLWYEKLGSSNVCPGLFRRLSSSFYLQITWQSNSNHTLGNNIILKDLPRTACVTICSKTSISLGNDIFTMVRFQCDTSITWNFLQVKLFPWTSMLSVRITIPIRLCNQIFIMGNWFQCDFSTRDIFNPKSFPRSNMITISIGATIRFSHDIFSVYWFHWNDLPVQMFCQVD